MQRIACLDLDAFFVEVALKDHPELRGKPLIVGGSKTGRGVVCSASYEARFHGIKSGMPVWQAINRYPNLFVLPVPGTISEFSSRVRERLKLFCPLVDTASIDEFFLDFTGCDRLYPSNLALADLLMRNLAEDPALPATIGFGTNKLIAKIASDLAKPRGLLEVLPGAEAKFLAQLELKRIPGVGPHTEKILKSMGLSHIGDICMIPPTLWRKVLGKYGDTLFQEAQGICQSPVIPDEMKDHQKRISRERTLGESLETLQTLLGVLSRLSEDASYDLRSLGLTCGGVTVKIRYDDFLTQTKSRKIPRTDCDQPIFAMAETLFKSLFTRRAKVRLVGVSLDNLQSGGCMETLWQALEPESKKKLPMSIDSIRNRFGFQAILRARSLSFPSRR